MVHVYDTNILQKKKANYGKHFKDVGKICCLRTSAKVLSLYKLSMQEVSTVYLHTYKRPQKKDYRTQRNFDAKNIPHVKFSLHFIFARQATRRWLILLLKLLS